MCKDHDIYYSPIEPTTIFRPSDLKAECLTTVTINDLIDFRWFFRNDSSKTWVFCYDWSSRALFAGEYHYAGYLLIQRHWLYYPRAYKVDVYLDGLFAFSDFFEITNGGLSSPRMCDSIDASGDPVNVRSRFTIGTDTKAYHFFKLDRIAYYNEDLGKCHRFSTVWIQPDGNTYKTCSASFEDYKDKNASWSFWPYESFIDDFLSIDSSTSVGNWVVEIYLDSYYFNNTWILYGPVATTHFVVGNEPVADWTFTVYLDADMDGETAGIEVFLKMANASYSSQTNVIVQMDRAGLDGRYGNWTDCKRFKITKGMTPAPENALVDLNETDMGDVGTLKDFVNWTMSNYPANHYCLVLWDHGAGFMGVCVDFTNGNNSLSLPELSQALDGLPAIVDVLLVDACSSAMIETAYQVKDCANVLIGPEGLGYAPGPYDSYLSSLNANTSATSDTFAADIVIDYMSWCNSAGAAIQNATISAVELTKISGLIMAADDFAANLMEAENLCHEQITHARNMAKGHVGPYSKQTGYDIDLYDLAQLTYQYVSDRDLRTAATQVMVALSIGNTIILEVDKADPDSHGLSVFFPQEKDKYDQYENDYANLAFAVDMQWSDSVKYHLSGCSLTIQTPYANVEVDIDNESRATDAEGRVQAFVMPGYCVVNVANTVMVRSDSRGIFNRWNDTDTANPKTLLVQTGVAETTLRAEYVTEYRLIMNANFGATDPALGEHWCKANSTVTISATPPNTSWPSGERYEWYGWNGPFAGNRTQVTVDSPLNETAIWKHMCSLTTISSHNSSTPLDEWFEVGAAVNTSVTSPLPGASGVQYMCTGWFGTGSVPASGTSTKAVFVIERPSRISWNWKTQYHLSIRTDPVGVSLIFNVSLPGPWYDSGTSVTCTAQQVNGYTFDHWTVGGASWDKGVNPIIFTVDASYEVIAYYIHARPWLDIVFSPDNLRLIVAILGILITSVSIAAAWIKTRKRRSTTSILLEEIDGIHTRLKTNPGECVEEFRKFENTLLEKLTQGRITESEHSLLEKKIEKHVNELKKQKEAKHRR
jgi:hypothetical protein